MDSSPQKSSFHAPTEFEALRRQTLRQIEKDFGLQGIEIQIEDEALPYDKLVKTISNNLEDRQIIGSSKLHSLLYQLDISEKFVQEEIFTKATNKQSDLLADAIIKRCFAKVVYRKKYS